MKLDPKSVLVGALAVAVGLLAMAATEEDDHSSGMTQGRGRYQLFEHLWVREGMPEPSLPDPADARVDVRPTGVLKIDTETGATWVLTKRASAQKTQMGSWVLLK
jgi:hypothetical protein